MIYCIATSCNFAQNIVIICISATVLLLYICAFCFSRIKKLFHAWLIFFLALLYIFFNTFYAFTSMFILLLHSYCITCNCTEDSDDILCPYKNSHPPPSSRHTLKENNLYFNDHSFREISSKIFSVNFPSDPSSSGYY